MEKWETIQFTTQLHKPLSWHKGQLAWDKDRAGRKRGCRTIFLGCSNNLKQSLYYSLTLQFSNQLSQCKWSLSHKGDLPSPSRSARQSNKKLAPPTSKFTFKCCSCKIPKADTQVEVGTCRKTAPFRAAYSLQASPGPLICWKKNIHIGSKVSVFLTTYKAVRSHLHFFEKCLKKKKK